MFRKTTLKISLCSAFAALFLLVAMLASSGTVSAHTANSHAGYYPPTIKVTNVQQEGDNCLHMQLDGGFWTPGTTVQLYARDFFSPDQLAGFPISYTVSPSGWFDDGNLTVCDKGIVILWAKANNGSISNTVIV